MYSTFFVSAGSKHENDQKKSNKTDKSQYFSIYRNRLNKTNGSITE